MRVSSRSTGGLFELRNEVTKGRPYFARPEGTGRLPTFPGTSLRRYLPHPLLDLGAEGLCALGWSRPSSHPMDAFELACCLGSGFCELAQEDTTESVGAGSGSPERRQCTATSSTSHGDSSSSSSSSAFAAVPVPSVPWVAGDAAHSLPHSPGPEPGWVRAALPPQQAIAAAPAHFLALPRPPAPFLRVPSHNHSSHSKKGTAASPHTFAPLLFSHTKLPPKRPPIQTAFFATQHTRLW